MNLFIERNNGLFHVVTKVVMPSKVKKDLLEKSEIDQKLFETLVKDRNKSGNINLWSPMKKRKLQTWKTMGKKIKVSSAGLACVAGGISVEVLLFWRRSREKSGYSSQFRNFPSRLPRLAWRPRHQKSTQGKKILPATQASAGQIVELQEDWNLFVHMMVICKSRPEIDIQEAVGTNEFTVVPISMFAPDGEMLQCPAKSALLSILEKLPASTDCSCYSR